MIIITITNIVWVLDKNKNIICLKNYLDAKDETLNVESEYVK